MNAAPDFALIGAAKAGTTQLAGWLAQHPGIYLSPVKEPHFFGREFDPAQFSDSYRRQHPSLPADYFSQLPLGPVHLAFVRDSAQYAQLFAAAEPHQVRGECSTGYLFSTTAAAEWSAVRPDARAVALLRDPRDRALSHYSMALRYGYVQGSFAQEWAADARRSSKGWGRSENFFELGCYADAVERWYTALGPDQLLLLDFADLRDFPLETYNRVLHHLGLAPVDAVPEAERFAARTPRFPRVNRWLHASGAAHAARRLIPSTLWSSLKNKWLAPGKPTLPADVRAALRAAYLPDQQRLQALLAQKGLHLRSVDAFLAENE
jgi:hypothetical protein